MMVLSENFCVSHFSRSPVLSLSSFRCQNQGESKRTWWFFDYLSVVGAMSAAFWGEGQVACVQRVHLREMII